MDWKKTMVMIFGSMTAAGAVVGVSCQALRQWRHGVPVWHHEAMIKAAKDRGFNLTAKQMRTATREARRVQNETV